MFKVSERSSGNVIGIRVSGKLLHADYQQFIPKLEELIREHGSIRCLMEMEDFEGFELRALWDELKFDTKHCRDIERCAVVGNRKWEQWATNLSKPLFYKATIKYFDVSELDQAWQWIEEGTCRCCTTCSTVEAAQAGSP
ncbi:MAG: hypothetical protein A2V70_07030 [Planctomycetes bacterium RBG_13_63_9]|nr:MAG: hypothetical protein A2V70_07030 [Planctomycetes bacterium RBG_13_63_9]